MAKARLIDYGLMASCIHSLLVNRPDLCRWHPHRALWGIHQVGTTDCYAVHLQDMVVLTGAFAGPLAGILTPGLELELESLVRALAADMPLRRIGKAALVTISINDQSYPGCVLVDAVAFPWSSAIVAAVPDVGAALSVVIPEPAEMPDLVSGNLNNPLLRASAFLSEQQFLAMVDHPPGIDLLPERLRAQRLVRWQLRHVCQERARLGVMRIPPPAWIDGCEQRLRTLVDGRASA
jgi:hypothetical protein